MTMKNPQKEKHDEKIARRIWVSFVVSLLSLQVVIGAFAINLAIGDPSAVAVPNYHQAALDWDGTHAKRTAANRMGLQFDIQVSEVASQNGSRLILVTVADQNEAPIDGLRIKASAFHHSRASRMSFFRLEEIGDGSYQSLAPLKDAGTWSLSFEFDYQDTPVAILRDKELSESMARSSLQRNG